LVVGGESPILVASARTTKGRGVRRVIALIGSGLVAVGLLAGCAGSGYDYIKSSSDRTYFKVPSKWTVFDEEDVVDRLGGDLTDAERQQVLDETWRVAFDASPNPTLRHLGVTTAKDPAGLAVVRSLSFDDSDAVSLGSLRNYFFDIDTAMQDETGEVVTYEDLQLDGGFRGSHLVANLTMPDGGVLTIDQTVLVDQATSKLYALIVSCSNLCYERNSGDIKKVVDSWTVRAK
jgi:hypothetical protein